MVFMDKLQRAAEMIYAQVQIPVCILNAGGEVLHEVPAGCRSGISEDDACVFAASGHEQSTVGEWTYFMQQNRDGLILALRAHGEKCAMAGRMASFYLSELQQMHNSGLRKEGLIRNIILGKAAPEEIDSAAAELGMTLLSQRCVFLIEEENDGDFINASLDVLHNLFPDRSKDFAFAVNAQSIVLVRDFSDSENPEEEVHACAELTEAMLSSELAIKVLVAAGSVVNDLTELFRSRQEAGTALEVGRIFYSEKKVIEYASLGIGRLFYQLDEDLCRIFLKDSLQGFQPSDMDEETLNTVLTFFDNNLNVSETARQLYVHRNTLVYRLDKLQKQTGLDLRCFDDAVTFKLALLVAKNMHHFHE